jgi:hypothetical protein
MTASMEHTPETPCERLLDYVYGELEGEALATFRAHLEGCAQCQRELQGFERVRGVVKQTLPLVEPPPAAVGAMHAQLLHAATQRRPSRGKVLQLFRKVAMHPGYAAAAALLLVGGAVGVQWSRGKLAMPPPAASEVEAPSAPAVAAPPPAPLPVEAAKPEAVPLKKEAEKDRDSTKLFLDAKVDGKPTPMPVSRPEPKAAPAKAPAPARAARKDDLDGLVDGEGFGAAAPADKTGSLGSLGTVGKGSYGPGRGGSAGASGEDLKLMQRNFPEMPRPAKPAPALHRAVEPKAAAPLERAREEQAPAPQAEMRQNAAPHAAAPPPPVAPPAATSAPASAASQQVAISPAALRAKAEELAASGRCDEAVRLYQQLESQYPSYALTPQQRLPYVQCRASLRMQQAPTVANESPTADEQRNILSRRASPKAAAKKAKKSKAAADDAANVMQPSF